MKKIYQLVIFLGVASLVLLNACTEGFEDINTRRDRVTAVEPEYLFGLTPVKTLREFSSNNNWYFFGNYTNQLSVIGGGGPHFTKDGRQERIWGNLYTGVLNPLFQIINNYGDKEAYSNRVAIAKIWRAYTFSQLVALYGPLPYTDACNGEPYIKYDTEPVIYRGILAELKEAYEALDEKGDKYPSEAEPFLGSDIKRWSQFAHAIRLRVALRLCDLPDKTPADLVAGLQAEARAIVAEELRQDVLNSTMISSNAGNFFMTFQLSPEESQNPLFREVFNLDASNDAKKGGAGNMPVIHESLVMWTYPYHDPCWDLMFSEGEGRKVGKITLSTHQGRPHSMESPPDFNVGISSPFGNFELYSDYVTINPKFMKSEGKATDYPFVFYSYAELCFTKAEAALLGYWPDAPKSAEQYYYDGIDARCAQYGAVKADVTDYKDFPGIKWGTESDTVQSKTVNRADFRDWQQLIDSYLGVDDNYKRIVVQHWISLFIQGWDSYTLLRRTGVLTFKPHFGADVTGGYLYTEDGRAWAYTPQRLCYPSSEFNINATETRYAIGTLLFDNKLKDPEDQVPFRLIFTKDAPIVDAVVIGTNGTRTYHLRNLSRNF
jgi:hypothetical protein